MGRKAQAAMAVIRGKIPIMGIKGRKARKGRRGNTRNSHSRP
jgi:hypothetical protein